MNKKKEHILYLKKDKEIALQKINISIQSWDKKNSKDSFLIIKSKEQKNLHWKKVNLLSNFFDIYLIWSNTVVKTLKNVEKEKVRDALEGLKFFYKQISTIKPDLTHPEILECYNITARKNNLSQEKKVLKEAIEVHIVDPFGNVQGKDKKKIINYLTKQKKISLENINNSITIFDQMHNRLTFKSSLLKPKNFLKNKDKTYEIKLFWCENELKLFKKIKEKEVKKKLILIKKLVESFNIHRPNINDKVIKEMNEIALGKIYPKQKNILIRIKEAILKKFKEIVSV